MSRNVLVIGQSHVQAIRCAARSRRETDPERPRTRTIHTLELQYGGELEHSGQPRFSVGLTRAIHDQVNRHQPIVASVMGGNYHNVLSLVRHHRPFDFLLSGEPSPPLDTMAEFVPEALIREMLLDGMDRDLLRLRLLAEVVGPFQHLESPPPVADDRYVAARAEEYFETRAIRSLGVAPAGLRYRMWRIHSRIIREACHNLGCGFIPVPHEVCDPDGFLRPAFAGDATHGNAGYGEAMIAAVEGGA